MALICLIANFWNSCQLNLVCAGIRHPQNLEECGIRHPQNLEECNFHDYCVWFEVFWNCCFDPEFIFKLCWACSQQFSLQNLFSSKSSTSTNDCAMTVWDSESYSSSFVLGWPWSNALRSSNALLGRKSSTDFSVTNDHVYFVLKTQKFQFETNVTITSGVEVGELN